MAISRRAAVKTLGVLDAGASRAEAADSLQVGGQAVELIVPPVGPDVVWVSFNGQLLAVPF